MATYSYLDFSPADKREEQPFRFGIFWLGTCIAGSTGGILAYFILQIKSHLMDGNPSS